MTLGWPWVNVLLTAIRGLWNRTGESDPWSYRWENLRGFPGGL